MSSPFFRSKTDGLSRYLRVWEFVWVSIGFHNSPCFAFAFFVVVFVILFRFLFHSIVLFSSCCCNYFNLYLNSQSWSFWVLVYLFNFYTFKQEVGRSFECIEVWECIYMCVSVCVVYLVATINSFSVLWLRINTFLERATMAIELWVLYSSTFWQ